MGTINLGRIGFSWKGVYSAAVTYNRQDVVTHNGDSYVCLVDNQLNVTPNTGGVTWDLFAQGSLNVATSAGQLVFHNGSNLVALAPGTAGQALTISSTTGLPVWGNQESRTGVRVAALPHHRNLSYRRYGCIMADGTVRLWGNNDQYQLGNGLITNVRSYPTRAAFPNGAAAASKMWLSRSSGVRVLDVNGHLWQWGENGVGNLGTGNTTVQGVPFNSSTNASNSTFNKVVTDVAQAVHTEGSAFMSTLALCSDGTVHATGLNTYGQLGLGAADVTNRSNFNVIPSLTSINRIYQGRERYTTSYALNTLNQLFCWGYNNEYQCGNGAITQVNVPTLNAFFNTNAIPIASLTPTYIGTFALALNGDLYYFGIQSSGHSGVGNLTVKATPTLVNTNVRSVWASCSDSESAFVIKTDNTVWAAGANAYGQLGIGNMTTPQASWVQVTGVPNTVTEIVCGGGGTFGYTAFLTSTGLVYTCGYNASGQLGIGTTTNTSTPTLVGIAGRTVVDIGTVGGTSEGGLAFLLDDQQILMTGYGVNAQNSDPADIAHYVPTPILF